MSWSAREIRIEIWKDFFFIKMDEINLSPVKDIVCPKNFPNKVIM